jgi:DNA-binding transcriptional ArsR family regulator
LCNHSVTIMRRDIYQAIADPTRREIIDLLAGKSLNLNDISSNFQISRPAVSKQIKILSECGLVTVTPSGREHYCTLDLKKMGEVADWIAKYKVFWTNKLDALGDFLEREETKLINQHKTKQHEK